MSDEQTLPRLYHVANRVLLPYLLAPLMRVRVTATGQEQVPKTGPLLVVSNHMSNLDPPLIGMLVPREITMMAKEELFQANRIQGWIIRNYGAFPVRRGAGDVGAIKQALKVLKSGGALFMAPEGTRSTTGHLGEPQEGTALIAVRSGVPLLPIGIWGQEKFADNIRRWQRTDVGVAIGRPFLLRSLSPKPEREELQAMSEAIMERIAELLPPAYRGRFTSAAPSPFVEEV